MFFSLNKKFIYTISIFFLLTSVIFMYTFYILYGNKIQEEQKAILQRNQQYTELLYENITLKNELKFLLQTHPQLPVSSKLSEILSLHGNLQERQQELSIEHKRTQELIQNYDQRYQALQEGIKIIGGSSILIILGLFMLWFLIRLWILNPINKLAKVSSKVLAGNYTSRLKLNSDSGRYDEFDELMQTFNQMLDNIENGIKEIKKTESFLQSIIDSIPDGIRVLDTDGTIVIANKEYYRQAGCTQECIGEKCFISSQKRNAPCPASLFPCPLREIKLKNAANMQFIQQFHAYPLRQLAVNAAPMRIRDPEQNSCQNYIVESIRDLSDDIRFSHQQKLSSLGFLATSVAHEIKNHLGSIRMITEGVIDKYYRDKPDEAEDKYYLTLVNKQLIECMNIPERLLKLAQFSTETPCIFNCQDCIHDIIALLDYEAKRNGITIDFKAPKKEITLNGSETDFKMMMLNMAQNAFKAMPNGGKLTISLRKGSDGKLNIKLQDNGIGIPADKIKRIFEPFYSDGQNSKHAGTGLGLAIVKSIVEKFNGEIDVCSKENKGTCFSLKIPLPVQK